MEALESRVAPATFTVTTLADSGTGSLREALAKADASPGPDTIKFKLPAPPLHSENVILLTSGELTSKGNVTIMGPGSGKLIIDGNNASRAFDINDGNNATDSPATISGLSIIRGKSNANGGGLYSRESLTLNDVVVSQCAATSPIGGAGGGVAVAGSGLASQKVQISNSLIAGNSSLFFGGGIDVFGVGSITLQRTVVTGNTAGAAGGGNYLGITATGTGIAISGCQINGNSGTIGGGMEFFNPSTLAKAKTTVSNTTIAGNVSTNKGAQGGGGLFVQQGKTLISGSTIENNTALYNGGGIDAADGFDSLTITKTTISGNQTTARSFGLQGGGGLYIGGSGNAIPQPVIISGSRIADNRSDYAGGGLCAVGGIALTVSGTTFAGNQAVGKGGGVTTFGTGANKVDITVTGSTFSNNYTLGIGAGLNASDDGRVAVSTSKVIGNVANASAGGIYAENSAATNGVILMNLTISGNFSNTNYYGGGILIYSTPDFNVTGGSFTKNKGQNGGAICIFDSGGSIRGALVTDNVAAVGGGVLNSGGGTVTLQVGMVHGNTAPLGSEVLGNFTFV
jgi:parallel beta-helix repeat protein